MIVWSTLLVEKKMKDMLCSFVCCTVKNRIKLCHLLWFSLESHLFCCFKPASCLFVIGTVSMTCNMAGHTPPYRFSLSSLQKPFYQRLLLPPFSCSCCPSLIPSNLHSILCLSTTPCITLYSWSQVFEFIDLLHLYLAPWSLTVVPSCLIYTRVLSLNPAYFHSLVSRAYLHLFSSA